LYQLKHGGVTGKGGRDQKQNKERDLGRLELSTVVDYENR